MAAHSFPRTDLNRSVFPGPGRLAVGLIALAAPAILGPASGATAWQQRADYDLDVRYDPTTHTVSGREVLRYHHQGPDTLREIWLHLRHDSVRPGTRLDLARQADGAPGLSTLDPGSWGECRIDSVTAGGVPVEPEFHEALVRLPLPRPLARGESVELSLAFVDHQPGIPVHSGYTASEFTLGEWYPKACVFDGSGWHLDPWLLRGEFYADFGSYRVDFTLPARYRLAHTGELQNFEQVLGRSERLRLDGLGERVVRVADADLESGGDSARTWRLRADRVHDFALAGSLAWSWRACRSAGTVISLYAPPQDAGRADSLCALARDLLTDFSGRFGPYPYAHLDVVLTSTLGASVEKPQMAWLAGEHATGNRSRRGFLTLAHEVAHQWFYGVVANDETREAWMDEGACTYIALRAIERRFGVRGNTFERGTSAWSPFLGEDDFRSELYREAFERQGPGQSEIVAQPSDSFRTPDTYRRAVYGRAALLFLELEYRLGPDSMERALRSYAAEWSFGHPRGRDLEACFSEALGAHADSILSRWLHSTEPVESFRAAVGDPGSPGPWRFDNTLARHSRRRADGLTVFVRPSTQFNDLDGWAVGARARLEIPSGGSGLELGARLPRRAPGEGWLPQLHFSANRRVFAVRGENRAWFKARRGEGREFLEAGLGGGAEGALAWSAAVERRNVFRPAYLRDTLERRPGLQDAWTLSATARGGAGHSAQLDLRIRGSGPAGPAGFLRFDGDYRTTVARRFQVRLSTGAFARLAERSGLPQPSRGPAAQELFQVSGAGPLAEEDIGLFRSHGPFGETSRISVPGGGGARGYAGRGISGDRYVAASIETPLRPQARVSIGELLGRIQAESYVFGDVAGIGGSPSGPEARGVFADGGVGTRIRALPWNTSVRLEIPVWISRPGPGERPVRWRWALSIEPGSGFVAGAR